MPESIRDDSNSITWKINEGGIGRVGLYSDGEVVSSANPIPVDVNLVASTVDVQLSYLNDSVSAIHSGAWSGTVSNLSIPVSHYGAWTGTVSATDLDIRDLTSVDIVTVRQGTAADLNFSAVKSGVWSGTVSNVSIPVTHQGEWTGTVSVSNTHSVYLYDQTDDYLDEVYDTIYGVKCHIVGDGDKFVRGVFSEGDAVGTVGPVMAGGESPVGSAYNLQLNDNKDLKITLDSETVDATHSGAWTGTVAATHEGVWSGTVSNTVTVSATDLDIRDLDADDIITVRQGTAASLNVTEANSGDIKTAVELIDDAISGTEMQVDVVASLPAGTNTIGKLAANTGVDIGDVDVTSMSHGQNIETISGTLSSATDTSIIAAGGAGVVGYLQGFSIIHGDTTAITIILEDGIDGTELWRWYFDNIAAGMVSGANLMVSCPAHILKTTANTALNMVTNSTGTIHYSFSYWTA